MNASNRIDLMFLLTVAVVAGLMVAVAVIALHVLVL